MTSEARLIAEVTGPHGGRRVVAVDAEGTFHLLRLADGADEAPPALSTTPDDAVQLARHVLAAHGRAMTDPHTLNKLAIAVLALAAERPVLSLAELEFAVVEPEQTP